MDRRQKEELRFLLKARKRAEKVLAARREAEQKKLEYKLRKDANQELMKQYREELTSLAEECGILAMAEQAAAQRGGSVSQQVSYYLDYGMVSSSVEHILVMEERGELRAAYLVLKFSWQEAGVLNEVEIRVHKHGQITFQHCFLPIFRFVWRCKPEWLQKMFTRALEHPRRVLASAK